MLSDHPAEAAESPSRRAALGYGLAALWGLGCRRTEEPSTPAKAAPPAPAPAKRLPPGPAERAARRAVAWLESHREGMASIWVASSLVRLYRIAPDDLATRLSGAIASSEREVLSAPTTGAPLGRWPAV